VQKRKTKDRTKTFLKIPIAEIGDILPRITALAKKSLEPSAESIG
jgi:hypothetical protein